MKIKLILALMVLGIISCKKEEVNPNNYDTPVFVAPETNHVKITVNSVLALDSIKLEYGDNYENILLNRAIRDNDPYYLCNLETNLVSIISVNDCSDGYLELIGTWNIRVICSGDCVVEYLDSTL